MDPEQSYIQPIPCKNKEVYGELNTLVFEYLEVNGLEQALHTFTKECQAKNLPCPRLGPGARDVKAAFTHYDGEHLLKSFDEGELETFLKLWKQFQNHIQVTSEDMKKLEVYLRVHFAIYPKATNQSEAKQNQAMQSLKGFFEEHSATLSSDATILPLFALPFVPDPRPHPIFKDLFHESWTAKLRAQLETTVNKYFELLQENITTHCKLASVVSKHIKTGGGYQSGKSPLSSAGKKSTSSMRPPARGTTPPNQTKSNSITKLGDGGKTVMKLTAESAAFYHQERFFQLMGVHRKTRRILRGIKESYGKLLRVTAELIKAVEASVDSNESVKLDLVLPQCFTIFPEIFTNMEIPGSQPNLEHFKKIAKSSYLFEDPPDSEVSLLFLGILDIGPETLNYEKIKADLMSETVNQTVKLCIMQSLRWMVTKTSSDSRSLVMASYLEHDILGLHNKKPDLRHKLFSCLLSPNPTYLKESLSRFVNALACLCGGRNYLTSTDYVIDILIKSLSTFKSQEESFICHMVVATLQKLSLRKTMRLTMIEQGVIPWIVKYIKTELDRDIIRDEVSQIAMECVRDSSIELTKPQNVTTNGGANNGASNNGSKSDFYGDSFNNYLMEYAWALLMNLCLHDESIHSAQSVDYDFLNCIVTMLTHKSSLEFIPYVISTLFSLLRNPEMFEKAKAMDLNQKLAPLIVQQTGEIATHLRHMLNQLYGNDGVDRLMETSGETDYDDTDFPDPEEVESELELYESWMGNQNEARLLTGDDLLIREYLVNKDILLPPPSSETERQKESKTQENPSDSVDIVKVGGLLLRPTTPTRSVPKTPRSTNLTNFSRPTTPGNRLGGKIRQETMVKSSHHKTIAESGFSITTNKESAHPINQAKISDPQSKKQVGQAKQNTVLQPESSLNPLVHPEPPYQKPRQLQPLVSVNANKHNNNAIQLDHEHIKNPKAGLQSESSNALQDDSTVAVYKTILTSETNTMNSSITSCFNDSNGGGVAADSSDAQAWKQNDDLPALLIRQTTENNQ